MFSTSRRDSGVGLVPGPDEAGDAGGVADGAPGVVVEVAAHEQVAREHLLLDGDLLAALELVDVLHGDDDLEDPVLDATGGDDVAHVRAHLVLVARVGVHDVPAARPVVGALDRERLLLVLVVLDPAAELAVLFVGGASWPSVASSTRSGSTRCGLGDGLGLRSLPRSPRRSPRPLPLRCLDRLEHGFFHDLFTTHRPSATAASRALRLPRRRSLRPLLLLSASYRSCRRYFVKRSVISFPKARFNTKIRLIMMISVVSTTDV